MNLEKSLTQKKIALDAKPTKKPPKWSAHMKNAKHSMSEGRGLPEKEPRSMSLAGVGAEVAVGRAPPGKGSK